MRGKRRYLSGKNALCSGFGPAVQPCLTRLIEIIGEAANRVLESIQTQYPDFPWLQMVGARNRLIHGYDSVDFDILWTVANHDLPSLITQLEAILDQGTADH
jgi:uncharacterized protein with HEPN domain